MGSLCPWIVKIILNTWLWFLKGNVVRKCLQKNPACSLQLEIEFKIIMIGLVVIVISESMREGKCVGFKERGKMPKTANILKPPECLEFPNPC